MTNRSDRDAPDPQEQSTSEPARDDALDEYAHLDPETVVEDAVELFEAGDQPSPILNPDDPPPAPERAEVTDHTS